LSTAFSKIFYGFSQDKSCEKVNSYNLVAAGILPAIEPGRPARRIKRPLAETKPELFRIARSCHRSFRVDGTPALCGRRDVHRYAMALEGANIK